MTVMMIVTYIGHTHTHTCTDEGMHSLTHTYTHMHMHMHKNTHTNTHTHTYKRTHRHTHIDFLNSNFKKLGVHKQLVYTFGGLNINSNEILI